MLASAALFSIPLQFSLGVPCFSCRGHFPIHGSLRRKGFCFSSDLVLNFDILQPDDKTTWKDEILETIGNSAPSQKEKGCLVDIPLHLGRSLLLECSVSQLQVCLVFLSNLASPQGGAVDQGRTSLVVGYRALQRDVGRCHGSHGLQTSFRGCQHTMGAPSNLPLSVPAAQKAGVVVEVRKSRQQWSLHWKGGDRNRKRWSRRLWLLSQGEKQM